MDNKTIDKVIEIIDKRKKEVDKLFIPAIPVRTIIKIEQEEIISEIEKLRSEHDEG